MPTLGARVSSAAGASGRTTSGWSAAVGASSLDRRRRHTDDRVPARAGRAAGADGDHRPLDRRGSRRRQQGELGRRPGGVVGVPRPAPSPSMTPPGTVSTTAWLSVPVKDGDRHAGSSAGNAVGRVTGSIGVSRVRWIGGRNAHPIGDGAGSTGVGATAAGSLSPAQARRPVRRVHGQRTSGHLRGLGGGGPRSGCVHRKAAERRQTGPSFERRQRSEVRARGAGHTASPRR